MSILQDLRFGARILARSPGFSVTAIVVLALGIGVSTLAFSLYNIIALQSIPVRDPATLVRIQRRSPENITPGVPYSSIAYYRDNAKSLSAVMATMSAAPMVLNQDEQRVSSCLCQLKLFQRAWRISRHRAPVRCRSGRCRFCSGCGLELSLLAKKVRRRSLDRRQDDSSGWKAGHRNRSNLRSICKPRYGQSGNLASPFATFLFR